MLESMEAFTRMSVPDLAIEAVISHADTRTGLKAILTLRNQQIQWLPA